MRKALSTAFALAIGGASQVAAQGNGCGTNAPITVYIEKDGSILWETTPVSHAEAIRRFSEIAKSKPTPNVRVVPDKTASYESVARILADAQKARFYCIGFTGIDTGR